ncbi:MAG: type IV pilin N-terminal domain-containing protein [Methanocorpusculum sp.]|nr:type IV pilin N-terminal domain-containing protein [Methanocorpusculum sp.]
MLSPSKSDDGVSPVIAMILIVGLTVGLIAISLAVIMGLTAVPNAAPVLGLSIELVEDKYIYISHLNGAVLPLGSYAILVDDKDKTSDFHPKVDLTPGTRLKWECDGAVGDVSVVYKSGGDTTLLAQKHIGKT